ncbi:MAG TPA: hypothetical protein VMB73_24890 [Acetobacteraceae bacterium]|nr:hypothetical protein [Acetobacteraceae bacterium]
MSPTRVADHIDHLDIAAALRSGANIAVLVRDLACAHGVSFIASLLDAFAGAVSRLSDAEVRPDETEDLLVALARAGIITGADSLALQVAHLRQTAG